MKKNQNKHIRLYRKSAKSHLNLTSELEEILYGLMLGDIHAERKNANSNTRIQFKQSIKNKAYIDHLYSLFQNYCGSNEAPKINSSFDSRPNKNKIYSSIKFCNLSLPCFNKFRILFYNSEGIKILPLNIANLLTARSLAYWIMDDGYKFKNGFYLCTESFSLNENEILKNLFKEKFNLDCGIHKHTNGYRLYIFSNSKNNLLKLVKPYLISHFYYKFEIENS